MVKIAGWRRKRIHCWVTNKTYKPERGPLTSLFKVEIIPVCDISNKILAYSVTIVNAKKPGAKMKEFKSLKAAYKYATAYRKLWSKKNGGKQ